jgi:hypothetical protein
MLGSSWVAEQLAVSQVGLSSMSGCVGNEVFLRGTCREIILKRVGATKSVRYESLWREDLKAWSWKISTVRSLCQTTVSEDTACWKRLRGCCGDLWIVEISGGAVITCTYESINPNQTPCIVTRIHVTESQFPGWLERRERYEIHSLH